MPTIINVADQSKQSGDRRLTDLFPLSITQRAVWFDQIRENDNPGYNLGLIVLLEGTVDESLLEKAINHTIKRNDALRLVMYCPDGTPFQRILPELEVSIPIIDFSEVPDAEAAAETYVKREFQKTFQLEGSPLFSFQLIRVSVSRSYLMYRCHQLITDSASVRTIYNTIVSTYNRLLSGRPEPVWRFLLMITRRMIRSLLSSSSIPVV